MDILRKELAELYAAQRLAGSRLEPAKLAAAKDTAIRMVAVGGGCSVVTDAASDRCHIVADGFAPVMGLSLQPGVYESFGSSDEDEIYARIHPEDIVDKRMLEYEFFRLINILPPGRKRDFRATSMLRMKDRDGDYRPVSNSTQILELSPEGNFWLILCRYSLSATSSPAGDGIGAAIIDNATGDIRRFSFDDRRRHLLTDREKQILSLIRDGKPSKQIADRLGISIHTVNRHRQNIIAKLSVANSTEAVTAATLMHLL